VRLDALPFILAALGAAAASAYLLTPLAMRLATGSGAIDRPDSGRRVHAQPIPRAGGLAVAAAFVGVAAAALLVNSLFTLLPAVRVDPEEALALLGGSVLAAAFGFIDDRWQIRARWQLLLQVVLAAVAITLGVTIAFINNPLDILGGIFSPATVRFDVPLLAAVATGIWIVGMVNSINFIDGLDGLSTGVALIAALTLGVISLTASQYQPMVALLCAVLAGALAGFLPWNFHPARVFIGTTGVFMVGYALAVLSILGTAKVAVALLVLGVPIIDTFWIITRRLAARRSPFTPDRGHIHHRLLDLGLTHRGAVLFIYGICAALAAASLLLTGSGPLYAFMGIVVGFGLVLHLLARRAGVEDALDASSYPEDIPGAETGPDSGPPAEGAPGPRTRDVRTRTVGRDRAP
jgi:UDP-GlcNAc:undecaprenyl-phosphate/decaprenyl-phosphate GlcNAc-1-phosphate transferase